MAYLAHHDALTDLANRTLLQTRLTEALARAPREKKDVAVLFLDWIASRRSTTRLDMPRATTC